MAKPKPHRGDAHTVACNFRVWVQRKLFLFFSKKKMCDNFWEEQNDSALFSLETKNKR